MTIHLKLKLYLPAFLRFRPGRGRRTPASSDPCISPAAVDASPLLTELQALCDHAARLGWLASREQHPDAYRQFAVDAIAMMLDGWRTQRADGTLADLSGDTPTDRAGEGHSGTVVGGPR